MSILEKLPLEIIHEIFILSGIYSIYQLRLVSKSWKDIIDSMNIPQKECMRNSFFLQELPYSRLSMIKSIGKKEHRIFCHSLPFRAKDIAAQCKLKKVNAFCTHKGLLIVKTDKKLKVYDFHFKKISEIKCRGHYHKMFIGKFGILTRIILVDKKEPYFGGALRISLEDLTKPYSFGHIVEDYDPETLASKKETLNYNCLSPFIGGSSYRIFNREELRSNNPRPFPSEPYVARWINSDLIAFYRRDYRLIYRSLLNAKLFVNTIFEFDYKFEIVEMPFVYGVQFLKLEFKSQTEKWQSIYYMQTQPECKFKFEFLKFQPIDKRRKNVNIVIHDYYSAHISEIFVDEEVKGEYFIYNPNTQSIDIFK